MVFQPKYVPGEQFSVPGAVASYKSNNPDTDVYATIGDGDSGITKAMLNTLMTGDLQPNLDGLVLEIEAIGSQGDRGGWTSDANIVDDLNSLRTHFTTNGKKLSVTTGGSGFTAELACSLPSWTGACPAQLPQDRTQNLTTFLGDISEIAWDIWTPQIYSKSMDPAWKDWMKQGYEAWSGISGSVQIVPSVPQLEPDATIASMQQILASWLTESGEFSGLANTKPIVGYPYTSAYEVPAVPEPTTLLLALLALAAVPLRVRHG